jgi:hypothetical protein
MGTTLTGTTPQDTYDSLIKVTDNGPISGTAKYLSDGLGNDSTLALSTSVVGINTSSPNTNYPLSIASASNANAIAVFGRASDNTGSIDFYQSNGSSRILEFGVSTAQVDIYNDLNTPMLFSTNATERMRITGAGNVGIGTTAPAVSLQVGKDNDVNSLTGKSIIYGANQDLTGTPVEILTLCRAFNAGVSFLGAAALCVAKDTANANPRAAKLSIKLSDAASETDFVAASFTKNGLCFNSDTAAANALDDYEEGTFTPTIAGSTTAGTATYTTQLARYTKIGRQVSCQIDLGYNSGTGTGNLTIAGLPFTDAGLNNPAVTIGYLDGITLTALNYAMAYLASGTTRIDFVQIPTGGGSLTSVAYDSEGRIILNVTYTA